MGFYKGSRESKRVSCGGDSMTVQSERDRVTLSNIINRAMRGGGLASGVPVRPLAYADISEAPTYMEALNVVRRAQMQFETLPAAIRDRFANNPELFLEFMNNPKTKDERIEMGLTAADPVPPPKPEPMEVKIVGAPLVDRAPASDK